MPGIAASLGYRGAGDKTEGFSGIVGQTAYRDSKIVHHLGDLLKDITSTGLFIEVNRPSAVIAIVVGAVSGGVDVEGPLAGELVGEPVRGIDKTERLIPDVALILAQPGGLEGEPLSGGR